MKNSILVILFAFAAIFSSCKQKVTEEPAPLIPMESFFKNGEKLRFMISPDGNYFSYLSDYKGMMNVFVESAENDNVVRVTNDTLRSINRYFWKGNRIIYVQDVGGDENYQLFSVKNDGTDLKALTPFAGVRTGVTDALRYIPGREKEMIVTMNKRLREYFDPYLLNIETGELTLLYENKENFDSWKTDHQSVIRLARKTDGVNNTWFYRNSENEEFTELLTASFKDEFRPSSFDKDNKNIYILSSIGRDKVVLVEYDPVSKKEVKELFGDDKYDLAFADYDRKKQALTSVLWLAEKTETHFFDKEWGDIQNYLESKFKGYEVTIESYDDEQTKAIFSILSDRLPTKYFFYDFVSKEIREIANPFPEIEEKYMSYMKPIKYTSRDGLEINGYLTVPLGMEPRNLPVIVNPHGGPWARDSWYFYPEVQFLANRGYAVFQMNFRGSWGYGKNFLQASYKEWGKKMQNDITDGVEWLIKEGIADKDRIGIFGASYGGYATLAGVAFTPDLYAAAVDYVGVSNLFTFLNTIPPYWKPMLDQFHEMVGDPKKDSLLLAEASPALHADKIKTPLFIAQGANDPRVNKAESDQMVEALKNRGIEVEYMVKDDEGHGFMNEQNQFDFYSAMEKFFEKHLKPEKK